MGEPIKKKLSYTAKHRIDPNLPLSNREKIFCQKYVELNNGTQAAIAAGYSAKTATTQASIVLSYLNIQNEILRLQKQLEKSTIATAQEVMEYFTKVMNGEIKDQFGLDAPLGERTKAATELAKRTIDWENRVKGQADAVVEIKLDWKRD